MNGMAFQKRGRRKSFSLFLSCTNNSLRRKAPSSRHDVFRRGSMSSSAFGMAYMPITPVPMELQLAAQGLEQFPSPAETAASVTVIAVGFNKLSSLPPSIVEYRNLRALHLNHNLLEDLPEELAALTELRELNLSSNPLRRLPNVLTRMPNLEVLNLDRTNLVEIPVGFQPARLRHLSLARNTITSLPEELFSHAGSLRVLLLHQNGLKMLPASLGGLIALEELDLSQNDLAVLPEELGHLLRLEILHLQSNRLRSLPRTIGQLRALRRLTLHENQLSGLPDSIGQLASLEWLDASHNDLTSLPDGIAGWTEMRHLVLSGNQLRSLPASFCRLPRLAHCFIQDNHLSDLPADDSTDGLPALQTMFISGNAFADDWAPPATYRKGVRKDEHGRTL